MNTLLDYYRRIWDQIHTKSANVVTPEQKVEYNTWLRQIITTMYCSVCKAHATQYIQLHPPENAENPFIWGWEFHNNVNSRLGKPIMPYSDAANKYLGWSI